MRDSVCHAGILLQVSGGSAGFRGLRASFVEKMSSVFHSSFLVHLDLCSQPADLATLTLEPLSLSSPPGCGSCLAPSRVNNVLGQILRLECQWAVVPSFVNSSVS